MNIIIICLVILCTVFESCRIYAGNVGDCSVSSKQSRVAPLTDQIFQVEKDKYNYNVRICSDVNNILNVSATQESPDKNITVLGRRNDSGIVAGSSWIVLTYGSGDEVTHPCSGPARVEIVITCCSDVSKPTLELKEVATNHLGNKGCFFLFDLITAPFQNCSVLEHSQPKDEGLSHGSVFCIIFLTTFGVYLVVGIFYRRLVKGAKGFEQIPHADFWRKLGNLQADGCDFVCRRGDRREESWQRLTNNFSDAQDDRDDALLRP